MLIKINVLNIDCLYLFSGSRNRRQESTTSVSSSTEASVQSYHTADSKGDATVHDEKGDNQLRRELATLHRVI